MTCSIRILVRIIALTFCLSLFTVQPVWGQGSAFTYQGTLNNNNVPGNGNFDFEFKLFDALNGGVQQGAAVQRLNVPVTNGGFTVTLDFGAAVFSGAPRFLEISVRAAGGGAFTVLSPRQQITATPYAIKAGNATAADGLSAACVGCVTSTQIQGGGAYINNTIAQQAGANFNIGGNGTIGGNLITNGNLGIGISAPGFKMHVKGNAASLLIYGQNESADANAVGVAGSADKGLGVYGTTVGGKGVVGRDFGVGGNGVEGKSVSGYGVYGESGATGIVGKSTNDGFGVYGESAQSNGVRGIANNPNNGAVVGVHNGAGIGVYGESSGTGVAGKSTGSAFGIGVYGESAQYNGVRGLAHNINHGAVVGVHDGGGIGVYGESLGTGIVGKSTGGPSGIGVYGESAQFNGVRGVAHNPNHGAVVGVHNNNGAAVFGTSGGIGVQGESTNAAGYGGYFSNTAGGIALGVGGNLQVSGTGSVVTTVRSVNERAILSLDSKIGGSNYIWNLESGFAGQAGRFAIYDRTAQRERLGIGPDGVVGIDVLQIRGGADFSENFDVNTAPVEENQTTVGIEPGMVVSIDPANPGKLLLSSQAYDRRVAGIISGAGGVKPGMVMSQEGTIAHGSHPVALSGRVYCLVDASQGAIEPGDLLTTSNIPGYAMKVADPAKAQGAIIGKAMTPLTKGKGLVLVLVSLQ